jgi:hypothetical protein
VDDGIFALDEENSDDAGAASDNEPIFELDGFEDEEVDEDGNPLGEGSTGRGGYIAYDYNASKDGGSDDLFGNAENIPEDADLQSSDSGRNPRARAQTSVRIASPREDPPLGVSPVLGSLLQTMAQQAANSPRDRAFTMG